MIKLVFLGTGPVGRIPRKGCTNEACKDARKKGSKSRRLQSSLFLQYKEWNILFDATGDILKQWQLIENIDHIDGIFITHGHSDAIGGIAKLKKVLKVLKQPKVKLFAERETVQRINDRFKQTNHLKIQTISAGKKIYFDDLSIQAFRVEHTFDKRYPTVGYIVGKGTKKIVFASDMKEISTRNSKKIEKADLFIVDSAMFKKTIPWHMNLDESLSLIKKTRAKQAFLTQIGIEWPPYKKALRIVKGKNPRVSIAYDGLTLHL